MTTFTVHPEVFRLITYFGFWSMVALAIVSFRLTVTGVDMERTPLVDQFGYNNICIYWDYSPAREIAALYYPLVEYPMVVYVFLTYLQLRSSASARLIPAYLYNLCAGIMLVQVVLFSWFRMIFVVEAFKDVKGHTLGFFGLQLSLALNAVHNFLFNQYIKANWLSFLGLSYNASRVFMWIYLIGLVGVTFVKLAHGMLLFYSTSFIDLGTPSGRFIAQSLDFLWMLFAALLPIPIAWMQYKTEPSMKFVISLVDAEGATVDGEKAEATEHLEMSAPASSAEDPTVV